MLFKITVYPFPWYWPSYCCCWEGRFFERSYPISPLRVEKGKLSLSPWLFGPWMIKVNSELTIWTFSLDINTTEEQVLEEIVKHVRQSIGPVAAFRKRCLSNSYPKTRSGKIPSSALSALVNGKPYKVNYQGCLVLGSDMFSLFLWCQQNSWNSSQSWIIF